MPIIHTLPEELINKIAAGEVIERPASIVKELIENSLDAKSTRIHIDIEDSGKALIRVSDNGEGMEKDDALRCTLRHATSKLHNEEELFAIQTLGFRGEALSSIAAVSEMCITTKRRGEVEAFRVLLQGGQIVSSGISAADSGTTMEVKNLFYNTPARKKFLKSDAVELGHIVDTIQNYALINPHVSFRLVHEGHELLRSPAVEDMRSNIASVYGVAVAKEMLEVNHQTNDIMIYGFISKPYHARNDRNQQAIFVNRRWVKNEDILNAIYDAYHSLLFVDKHPICVLSIELDPATIDVNVHPQKTKIKIEQKDKVYQTVYNAIAETLRKHNLVPVMEEKEEQGTLVDEPAEIRSSSSTSTYAFEPSRQFTVEESAAVYAQEGAAELLDEEPTAIAAEGFSQMERDTSAQQVEHDSVSFPSARFPPLKLLGQIHRTYFVAETLGGLYYIDQHAAHERVLYERFMKQYMNRDVQVQRLLQAEMLEFTPSETNLIRENIVTLAKFGYTLEEFGKDTFMLRTVPMIFGRLQSKEILFEVLALLREGKSKVAETKEEIVTRMACRAAVMAGDLLMNEEMDKIMEELAATELPFSCPHGRPTMLKVPVEELEKKFRRR